MKDFWICVGELMVIAIISIFMAFTLYLLLAWPILFNLPWYATAIIWIVEFSATLFLVS